MSHRFTNSLIKETSPYLLQHAHNPVNWFAWGDSALQKAKAENKIILVSIGYSACHWCHVMEKESFENETVAGIMNEHFVNVKIDREERPDLDHIYMDALQAMTGSGGWPLNIFLTPDKKPFFGGTYFPPVKAFNRSSWTEVLIGISHAWKERKNEIESQAENLTAHLEQSNTFIKQKNDLSIAQGLEGFTAVEAKILFSNIMKNADKVWGGFGNAPKFPQTFVIQFLFQYYYYTKHNDALEQALLSIDRMLQGGIYDHVGGGLARYSTDAEWLAPHFEKMLYDNALFINILCDAYQLTGRPKYATALKKTINFVIDELMDNSGAFYSALDADSEGEEGKYYVWEKEQIEEILGADAEVFCSFFDITEQGNWDGKNILRILKSAEEFAIEQGLDAAKFDQTISACLQKLSAERNKRVKPSLDDKIILSWNSLMLKAIAKAALILQDDTYFSIVERNFKFIRENFTDDSDKSLLHTYKSGVAKYPGFLDDYAYFIAACLQIYQSTFDLSYLNLAKEYCIYVIENFSDDDFIFFFFTHEKQKDVIVRKKEIYDGATPSGNSVMADNLYMLGVVFDKMDWRQRAAAMIIALQESVVKYPSSFAIWAMLLLRKLQGFNEIGVVGKSALDVGRDISLQYLPNSIQMASLTENCDFPLLSDKTGDSTLIYLCRNYSCTLPHRTIESLLEEINKSNKIEI